MKSKFSISPEKMAEAYAWLAVSGECSGMSGKYLDEKCHCVSSSRYCKDKANIDKMMEMTMKYIIPIDSLHKSIF